MRKRIHHRLTRNQTPNIKDPKSLRYGFTLLEIMVVFSITAFIFGLGIAAFTSYTRKQIVDQATQDIKAAIDRAKFSAISRVKPGPPPACTGPAGPLKSYKFMTTGCGAGIDYCIMASCNSDILIFSGKLPKNVAFYDVNCTSLEFKTISNAITCSPGTLPTVAVGLYGNAVARLLNVDTGGNVAINSVPMPNILTINPEADSYVDSAFPSTNFGMSMNLRVVAPPPKTVNSYLRFNVVGVVGPVTYAILKIYANSSQTTGYTVNKVADNTWGETTIIFPGPPIGTSLGSSGPVTTGNWYSVNVTSYVTGNAQFSFALNTTSSPILSLASRESANKPQLIIYY